MMTCRDDSGRSLVGAIDGANLAYRTSFPMRLDRPVEVFVNGLCRMGSLDNGYDLTDPYTVTLREALEPGDTLSVRYNTSQLAVSPPYAQPLKPDVEVLGAVQAPMVRCAERCCC